MRTLFRPVLTTLVLAFALLSSSGVAAAAASQLDTGMQINTDDPFKEVQEIPNVFESKTIYGKLEGETPIDIFRFTADKDGEQTFSLLGEKSSTAAPILIIIDPTDATTPKNLGVPVPSDDYHTALITPIQEAAPRLYNEPALFKQFQVYAEQRITLHKDKTYFFVILDTNRVTVNYGLKLGDAKSWGAGDIFTQFGTWFKVKTNSFAGTSPFTFPVVAVGLLIFLLGFTALMGTWIIQEVFTLLANKMKTAGYILIKFQYYSRVLTWISLWFMALGGYMHFEKVGFNGVPFVLGIIFVLMAAAFVFYTFYFSPRLMKLEVTKQEATIDRPLRKLLYINFAVMVVLVGAFMTFLTMYFA